MKKIVLFAPLLIVIFITIILLFFLLEDKDPRKPPSALLNKNLPEFVMVNLFNENKILTNVDFNDKQIIINFFSSWCAPCKVELPLLLKLKNNKLVDFNNQVFLRRSWYNEFIYSN